MTTYKGYDEQERGTYNSLTSLWKSLDVSRAVTSTNGTVVWPVSRVEKQSTDIIGYYDSVLFQPMANSVPGASTDYARKLASVGLAPTFVENMNTPSGTVAMTMAPNFMLPQYGKEPLYLWAKSGNATALKWLQAAAKHASARLVQIGGTAGVDGCVGVNGSSFPLKMDGSVPGFTDTAGWAAWVKTLCPSVVNTSFDGAQIHTATQMEGLLRLARDAGVAGLDETLTTVQSMKSRTTALKWPDLQMHKHLAGPAQ
jgi:hypothetical protein